MKLDVLLYDTAAVDGPSDASLARARDQLDLAAAAGRRSLVVAHRRRRRHRRLMTAALTAAAVAAGVIAAPTIGIGNRQPAATVAATEVLEAAAVSAGQGSDAASDAAYWHVTSEYMQVSRFTEHSGKTFTREAWIGNGREGALIDPGVHTGVQQLDAHGFSLGDRALSWEELAQLPTDADRLEEAILRALRTDDRRHLFSAAAELLAGTPATPELRRALWLVAARTPDVELTGATTDAVGRRGVAVRTADTGFGYRELVLDDSTGQLLEQRTTGSGSDAEGELFRVTYLSQGPADRTPTTTHAPLAERRS
jgi:hypothetical protein